MAFDPTLYSLYEFLSKEPVRRFGLALSGGVDSMALFYALLEITERLPLNFCALHVDHGWRASSAEEAAELKKLCDTKGVHFFSTKLTKSEKNSEEAARKGRYTFFKEVADQEGLNAVMLAHHANDLAENVLKRFFEGASLENLGNLEKKSFNFGLELWRPFLDLDKSALIAWMQKRQLPWFEDTTNEDPKYLRSRMRGHLIPKLESLFGKNFSKGLIARAAESKKLRHSLENRVAPYWKHYQKNRLQDRTYATILETRLTGAAKLTELELCHLIKKFFEAHELKISREEKALLARLLMQEKCMKRLEVSTTEVVVSSGRLEIELKASQKLARQENLLGI